MPYVLKVDALPGLELGQEVEITERCFFGGQSINVGDEALLWYSGAIQRLVWSAEVVRVGLLINGRITSTVRIVSQAAPSAVTTAQLAPFRTINDGSPLSELCRKFYRHAHNKVAGISEAEAFVLRQHFV